MLHRTAQEERELLEVLLAEPALVPRAVSVVRLEEVGHPGLRQVLRGLYEVHARGQVPTLDDMRQRLENPELAQWLIKLHDKGQANPNRAAWLEQVLRAFQQRRVAAEKQELHNQLQAASDHETALALLRQLQNQRGFRL